MLIDKLSAGVLRVLTPVGPRYVQLNFSQRIYMLWIFRHFGMLPLQVLSQRQRELIDALCVQQKFLSLLPTAADQECPVIGTVERRPAMEVESLPPRRPNARVVSAAAAAGSVQQRS
jgi:hypothetical protein